MDVKQSGGNVDSKNGDNDLDFALNASQQASDQYFCPRCEQTMRSDEKGEHDDWHFAKDLQEQDQGGAIASQPPAQPAPHTSQLDSKAAGDSKTAPPPGYAPPSYPPPTNGASRAVAIRHHTNQVIEAAHVRARDEQQMQNALQTLQLQYNIYNSEIEPEHETDYYCNCPIHHYQRMKWSRYQVQEMWSNAVMYPGEKAYNDNNRTTGIFSNNPYKFRVVSPYGYYQSAWRGQARPQPGYHAQSIHQTIALNNALNGEAQANINAKEPKVNIWDDGALEAAMSQMNIAAANERKQSIKGTDKKFADEKLPIKGSDEKRQSISSPSVSSKAEKPAKTSKLSSFRKSIGIKSTEERVIAKTEKMVDRGREVRNAILAEEAGRWPDEQWRYLVAVYQDKVGMTRKIADLRTRHPIQYLHLLRAGYFEPIPVAWANQASNPLKFSIESAAGWRGITPAWRGYEDTAEERLYWVLNHREGSVGMRMKPDFISEMDMARARMATAVEPPPEYYSANDTCHVQHTSAGYSRQVMPTPFVAYDRPEAPTDDTMILLDVSGSMDFDPLRPNYNQYLITGYSRSTQPKNKDVAKAIIRRFTDAMANHDHEFRGYDLTTFSSQATYIGTINHQNLNAMWRNVRIGGGTRVMTGWQKVKELHFQKHSESATHHPVYGWQAGPETPMLRLLLLLDGEATDMDEFELDLLGLSWAHVTIFLIGVDGCPHHHRHANELQRISDVNHHVSFVDAQGNTPERFVTHELLKRHLGYAVSMAEFEQMEELPGYTDEIEIYKRLAYLVQSPASPKRFNTPRLSISFPIDHSDATPKRPPILIIGGIIIGLTLAQALHARSIPFHIYERDAHSTARGPGWGLTIHWALAIFKLPDAMVDPDAVARGEKGSFVFYDARTAEALFRVPPSERLRLRREALRGILMPEIDVQWSKSFSHISMNEDGDVQAHFEDGTASLPGSVVVGCDGAHLRVRQMLKGDDAECYRLPIRCLGATVIFPTSVAKAMRDLDPYFMQMGDKTQDVFVYFAFLDSPTNNDREDKETRTCQIFMSWPLRPEKGLGEVPESSADRLALMKLLSSEWASPFREIIQAIPADTKPVTLRLEDWLPQTWDNQAGSVTLAGDACHAMTMYRGEAFNHGLKDLASLLEKIEKLYRIGENWQSQRKELIDEYEAEVRARTYAAVLASRRACLDAHDQAARLTVSSPLVAMRTMNVAELDFE